MKTKQVFFISIVLSFFCLLSHAQLKVLSNGKTGIGTNNPKYGLLDIGKTGVNNGLAIYDSSLTNPVPLRLYSDGDYGYLNFGGVTSKGITIKKDGRIGLGYYEAIDYSVMSPFINVFIDPTHPVGALLAEVKFPFEYGDVITVMSRRDTDMAYVVRKGNLSVNEITFYANGEGTVYAKNNYLTASDESYKENVTSINNSLNRIKQMRGVTYKLKEQVDETIVTANTLQNDSSSDTLSAQFPVPVEIANKIKAENKRKRAGFIAQELEGIFPEAVYTLPNGKKAIAYSEIIPLLVEAIKEQQNEIDELKQSQTIQTRSLTDDADEQSDVNSLMNEKRKAKLYSNIPNPFKEETTISYFVSEAVSSASLHIYNLQGKQMKQVVITERGNNSIVLKGYEFVPGMYMYSLIVDGKEVDTKKMILTE